MCVGAPLELLLVCPSLPFGRLHRRRPAHVTACDGHNSPLGPRIGPQNSVSADEANKIAKDAYIFCFPPFGGELRDAVAQCLDLEVAHHLPLKFFASVRIAAAIAFACLTSK